MINDICEILNRECGAQLSNLDCRDIERVYNECKESGHRFEYRLGLGLGFGGKLRNDREKWYIDCYQEDETPEGNATIERVNKLLATFAP